MNLKNVKISDTLTLNSVLHFGKYKGETIESIVDKDARYIEWCFENIDNFKLDNQAYVKYETNLGLENEIDAEEEFYNEQF